MSGLVISFKMHQKSLLKAVETYEFGKGFEAISKLMHYCCFFLIIQYQYDHMLKKDKPFYRGYLLFHSTKFFLESACSLSVLTFFFFLNVCLIWFSLLKISQNSLSTLLPNTLISIHAHTFSNLLCVQTKSSVSPQ